MKQMLTEVVHRGRKLYSVAGSCIVDRERKSLASYPFPFNKKSKLISMKLRNLLHVERNKMFVWFDKDNNLKSHFRAYKNAT